MRLLSAALLLAFCQGFRVPTISRRTGFALDDPPAAVARVFGIGANSAASGLIKFTKAAVGDEYVVSWNLTRFPPGERALHIHDFGDTTSSTGAAAGPHYNPFNRPHGCYPDPNRHVGDLGNITIDANGNSEGNFTRDLLVLSGETSIIGRAVIVHEHVDNCVEETSGGPRIAQGVIGIGNSVSSDLVYNSQPTEVLIAHLQAPHSANPSNTTGIVRFRELVGLNDTIEIWATMEGVENTGTDKFHGFHIHIYGDWTLLDGKSAGPHFNWNQKQHGLPRDADRHAGDLGNVESRNGVVHFFGETHGNFTLLKGNNSIIGRFIQVTRDPDQGSAHQPDGASGDGVLFGVIGLSNQSWPVAPTPGPRPPTPAPTPVPSKGLGAGYVFLLVVVALGGFVACCWVFRKNKAMFSSREQERAALAGSYQQADI